MFDPSTGKQIYLSDILGKEFADYDNQLMYIENLDLEKKTISICAGQDYKHLVLDINPDNINMKYIYPMPHSLEITELEKPLKGETDEIGGLYGYESSYILEYGPEKTQWPIEGAWHITAKRKCYSHGRCWYECWDTDDNDYYGWINSFNINFYN